MTQTTINQKTEIEVKNWLDKHIDPALRNSDEVVKLNNDAIAKVVELCEANAGYKFGCSDATIIDTVNKYFISIFYQ